jgi:hypothetical protein
LCRIVQFFNSAWVPFAFSFSEMASGSVMSVSFCYLHPCGAAFRSSAAEARLSCTKYSVVKERSGGCSQRTILSSRPMVQHGCLRSRLQLLLI